jgi:hypothetical protein
MTAKSTKPIDILPLITVWLQVESCPPPGMVAARCAQAEIAPTISDANICIPILLCVPDPDYQLEVANFGNLTASAKVEQMGNIGRYLSERSNPQRGFSSHRHQA